VPRLILLQQVTEGQEVLTLARFIRGFRLKRSAA
jgi:hypothetical protein